MEHSHEEDLKPRIKNDIIQETIFLKSTFVANPHALVLNRVVTEVVFMQDYSEEEIVEKLKGYKYDYVVRNEEYGTHLVCGDVQDDVYTSFIGPKKPFNSWLPNLINNQWVAPVEMPTCDGKLRGWNEDTLSWDVVEGVPLHEVIPACPSCSSK